MIASLFSANGVAAVTDSCQGYDVKASCQASRQSLSGITQDWSIADGQWLVFSDMTNNASGGAVFLQQGAEFSLLPENETGMTLFANNTVTGEYNNGGAIFAKENSTLNLTDVIFSGNVAGGYGGAIYSSGTNDTGAVDLRVTNAMFRNNIANDGKGGAIYTINNFYTKSTFVPLIITFFYVMLFLITTRHIHQQVTVMAMAGQSMLPIIIATASILQVIR